MPRRRPTDRGRFGHLRRRLAAIATGSAAAVALFAVLAATGLGIAWLARSAATRADLALAGLLWLGVAATVAWATGGWIAGRLARVAPNHAPSLGLGAATGLLALALLLGLGNVAVGDAVDLASAAYALGLGDTPERTAAAPNRATAAPVGSIQTSEAARIARRRTLDSVLYLAALGVLLLGASLLGFDLGRGARPSVARPDRRTAHRPLRPASRHDADRGRS